MSEMRVASKTERRVFLWRIRPTPLPTEAIGHPRLGGGNVNVELDEIIDILEGEFNAGRARVYLKDGKIIDNNSPDRDEKSQIYIADLQRHPDTQTVTVLINRGDPNAAAPAFIGPAENTVRYEQPGEDEALGASAHLVISLGESDGMHRACFEQMPLVSSSIALLALDRIIRIAVEQNPMYSYEWITRDNRGHVHVNWKRYRPVLSTDKVPSERLIDDLDEGELTGVTLTKRRPFYAGVGRELVRRQEEKIVIHFNPSDKQPIVDALRRILT